MPPVIKPKVKVLDKKERQRRIEVVSKLAKDSYAIVGVKDASRTYPGSNATLGKVAASMEFGTDTAPSRSFLRTPIDTLGASLDAKQQKVLDGIINGQLSIAAALGSLGFFVANHIQNSIYRGIDPELKDATRARKRTERPNKGVSTTPDTPLMDTHLLVESIGYEVYLGDGGGE